MSYPGTTNEIVTLAEVKALDNISVATYDTFISALIPTVSRSIEDYCRRRFVLSNWVQWCTIDREVITDNWPINNVLLIGVPYDVVLITDTTGKYNFAVMQQTSNNINLSSGLVVTDTQALTTTAFSFDTHKTLAALKTIVESTLTGVTFAYQSNPTPVDWTKINTLTLRNGSGKTLTAGINYFDVTTGAPVGNVYRISDNSDRIIMNPNYVSTSYSLYSGNYIGPYTSGYDNIDTGNYGLEYFQNQDTLIVYNAGYATADVPQTLKWVVASVINDIMSIYDVQASGVSKNIYSGETLGDYSYKLDPKANIPEILNRYAAQLDYYKKKCI